MDPNKIHPFLMQEMNEVGRLEGVRSEGQFAMPIIVRVAPSRGLDEVSVLASRPGFDVQHHLGLISSLAGSASPEEIEALSESDMVEYIWFDEPVSTRLDKSVPLIEVPPIWEGGNEGAGVRIAIVDTGIDAEHPDFAGRIAGQKDFTGEGDGDGHGHGTHVASTAAGSGAASNGSYRGVAPKAEILAAKVLRSDGNGRMSLVIAGMEWAIEQGAQIINLSLGSRGNCDGTDATSAASDMAVEQGFIVVAAAGNEGPGRGTLSSPGCARNVITVGASTDDDTIADFSSRGPTKDGRVKPDVVLPGAGIVAARAKGTSLGQPLNERYTSMNGTSMATPHAAGLVALMLVENPALRPAEVKRLLMEAVQPLGVEEVLQGKGRVIARRALELVRAAAAPNPAPGPTPTPAPQPQPQAAPEGEGCLAAIARLFGGR